MSGRGGSNPTSDIGAIKSLDHRSLRSKRPSVDVRNDNVLHYGIFF